MIKERKFVTVKEKKILLSDTEWRNGNIMDAAQKLICKALGKSELYQSVLNRQKRGNLFSILVRSIFNFCTRCKLLPYLIEL